VVVGVALPGALCDRGGHTGNHRPSTRDFAEFLDSDRGEEFFRGEWGWFAVIVVLAVFNTVLGEELLFRGLLLPRMRGVFGRGDTCYGDSGGPHFLGGMTSNLIVSLTVTGDAMCRATDKTYRLDTPSAQEFLSRFGLVPAP
jgi:hypothetical protein